LTDSPPYVHVPDTVSPQDLYEGMVHNCQDRIPDAPESALALSKMRDFLHRYLGI
jgi:hypothetical protein